MFQVETHRLLALVLSLVCGAGNLAMADSCGRIMGGSVNPSLQSPKTIAIDISSLVQNDFEKVTALFSDPKVQLMAEGLLSSESTPERVRMTIESSYEKANERTWAYLSVAIRKKGTQELIGVVRLVNQLDQTANLAFAIFPEYWNQGVLTDALPKAIKVAKERIKLKMVRGVTAFTNKGAQRGLEKCGFSRIADFEHPWSGSSHVQYELNLLE